MGDRHARLHSRRPVTHFKAAAIASPTASAAAAKKCPIQGIYGEAAEAAAKSDVKEELERRHFRAGR